MASVVRKVLINVGRQAMGSIDRSIIHSTGIGLNWKSEVEIKVIHSFIRQIWNCNTLFVSVDIYIYIKYKFYNNS